MNHETELRNFLDQTLNYVENNGENSDKGITEGTAKSYRAAASLNILCVLKSLTKDDIENRLGDNPTRDHKRAAVLLAEAFSMDKFE